MGQNTPAATNLNSPCYARETILPNRARVYRRTDRRTDRVIPVYPPNFVAGV